jgi:FG-GAP-like repeat
MRKLLLSLAVVLPMALTARAGDAKPAMPVFRMQELETKLGVGYAVLVADVNGDGKPDIIVVDTTRVVWYENPTWKRRTIIEGMTKADNVCATAYDIDGDGKLDLALGADWKPFNTKEGGTLQWLKQGKNLDDPWTLYPIGEEPTVHRIRFIDLYGEGKPRLVVTPLMGRYATQAKNWMDGSPVRILAYGIPKDPTKDRWVPEVIDESLHVVHNFAPVPRAAGKGVEVLTASYEGVSLLTNTEPGKWTRKHLGDGNQENPNTNRGSSEIKQGHLKSGRKCIATIEPWHGNQVVVYTEPAEAGAKWERHVIDQQLKWGHAVWCADLDGDGNDELVIGVRDDLSKKDGERCGVRVYKALDEKGAKWQRNDVDPGGVAVEDLTVADLNGDGKLDIIAVGRATKNLRIYWNEGKK